MAGTIIAGLIVAAAAGGAVTLVIKDKKKGKCNCGGNCSCCGMQGGCHGNKK